MFETSATDTGADDAAQDWLAGAIACILDYGKTNKLKQSNIHYIAWISLFWSLTATLNFILLVLLVTVDVFQSFITASLNLILVTAGVFHKCWQINQIHSYFFNA